MSVRLSVCPSRLEGDGRGDGECGQEGGGNGEGGISQMECLREDTLPEQRRVTQLVPIRPPIWDRFIHLCIYLSIHPFTHLPIHQFSHPSTYSCLSFLLIHRSVHLFTYPHIHASNYIYSFTFPVKEHTFAHHDPPMTRIQICK